MIIGFPALSLGAVAMGGKSRKTDKKTHAPKRTDRRTDVSHRSRVSRPSKKSVSY